MAETPEVIATVEDPETGEPAVAASARDAGAGKNSGVTEMGAGYLHETADTTFRFAMSDKAD